MSSTGVVLAACELTAQLSYLAEKEGYIGGTFAAPSDRTDNGNNLTRVDFDYKLFLVSISSAKEATEGHLAPSIHFKLFETGCSLYHQPPQAVDQSRTVAHPGPAVV